VQCTTNLALGDIRFFIHIHQVSLATTISYHGRPARRITPVWQPACRLHSYSHVYFLWHINFAAAAAAAAATPRIFVLVMCMVPILPEI